MATDIKDYFPHKHVTLVHSRPLLMNKFHPKLHEIIMDRAKELGIDVVLGKRAKLAPSGFPQDGSEFEVTFAEGSPIKSDFAVSPPRYLY